jgi:uncharacterized protein
VLIQIDKLKRKPRQVVVNEQATDFPVLRELIVQESVLFQDRINGLLEATWAGDVIEISGHLETTLTTPCSRCLAPVTAQLRLPVTLCYAPVVSGDELSADEELEIQAEELGLIPFSGTEVDLRPDIEQEIIMAIPQQPLCTESCQGLCLVCGHDLNRGQCDCEPPIFHPGLAALKNFKA